MAAQGRSEPTPEIRAKTEELTQAQSEALAIVQALYDYVSTNIRYVELPLGQGSWRPHTAAEVFSNKYGDSQDKHILLAAMLQAAGISSDAVLIPYTRKLDASAPSPAQFDHVITAVPLGTFHLDGYDDRSRAISAARFSAARQICVARPSGRHRQESWKRPPIRHSFPRKTSTSTDA